MANFSNCINFVLQNEGGILKDKTTGEYSNFGITQKLLIAIKYYVTDPKDLTITDAKNIYMQQFWQKYRFDLYKSDKIAQKILDMFVNMGPRQASLLVQDALGFKDQMRDGVIGWHTRCEINEWNEDNLLEKIINQCKIYYTALAAKEVLVEGKKTKIYAKYLNGWLNRAGRV